MQKIPFGRLGWEVSVAGLGCGGPSRLGTRLEGSMEEAADVVRAALDGGVNFIDTAMGYGTEPAVRMALDGRRGSSVYVATKVSPSLRDERMRSVAEIREALENSLKGLGRDHIDIYQMHGVLAKDYPYVREEVVPALLAWKEEGLIRALGITERFEADQQHEMLKLALEDDCWDSMMVGFNLLNPGARELILPACEKQGIGTLIMFAVRRVFSQPERAKFVIHELIEQGVLSIEAFEAEGVNPEKPFDLLLSEAASVPEGAYRFCRHEPGADVILSGTGNIHHLHENILSIQAEPLSDALLLKLKALYGHVNSVTGG